MRAGFLDWGGAAAGPPSRSTASKKASSRSWRRRGARAGIFLAWSGRVPIGFMGRSSWLKIGCDPATRKAARQLKCSHCKNRAARPPHPQDTILPLASRSGSPLGLAASWRRVAISKFFWNFFAPRQAGGGGDFDLGFGFTEFKRPGASRFGVRRPKRGSCASRVK